MSELGVVAVLSVALMFLVLAGEFASFTTPLLVMLTVPLAGVGGIVVLWLTGQSLNAVSLIGMVVMIGLADNDAVVKLDAIRRFREQGHPMREAVLLGGRQRLRAIAMTSLTTIVGVLPLVFGWGSGGELYQPLAAGVIGGSVTATLVTFFLLPTAYAVVEARAERRQARPQSADRGNACPPTAPPSTAPPHDLLGRASSRRRLGHGGALVLAGGVALTRLPIATRPYVELPRLTVSMNWPGASAELVETYLGSPIEAAIQSVRGVRKIEQRIGRGRSSSSTSSSRPGANVQLARLGDSRAAGTAPARVPARRLRPAGQQLRPRRPRRGAADRRYTVYGPYTAGTLQDLVDRQVKPRLSRGRGRRRSARQGGALVGVAVAYQPERLRQLGIAPSALLRGADAGPCGEALGVRAGGELPSARWCCATRPTWLEDLARLPVRGPGQRFYRLDRARHHPPRGRQPGPLLPGERRARGDDADRPAARRRRDPDRARACAPRSATCAAGSRPASGSRSWATRASGWASSSATWCAAGDRLRRRCCWCSW